MQYLGCKHIKCVLVFLLHSGIQFGRNVRLKKKNQYLTDSYETVLNSVFIFILCVYAYWSLPSIFLPVVMTGTTTLEIQPHLKFNPKEVGWQGERMHMMWRLRSHTNIFLSSEFYFNCASHAWSCFLWIQLHHFYLGIDPRPLLQFIKWMGLHLQRYRWRVRIISFKW